MINFVRVLSPKFLFNLVFNFQVFFLQIIFMFLNIYRGDIGDDPLDDQGAIQQVMEQIAIICRCEYEKSAELIVRLFDHDYTIYERSASNPQV